MRLTSPEGQQPFTITGGPGTSDPGRFRAPRINMICNEVVPTQVTSFDQASDLCGDVRKRAADRFPGPHTVTGS